MILERHAREFYELQIATDTSAGDPVAVDAWEASFDGGATWVEATVVTHDTVAWSGWLLAGPDADVGDAVAVIAATLQPLVRVVDGTEIVVLVGPQVTLV